MNARMIRKPESNLVHLAQYEGLSLCHTYDAGFEVFEGQLGSQLAGQPHLCLACGMVTA